MEQYNVFGWIYAQFSSVFSFEKWSGEEKLSYQSHENHQFFIN
jgi:hypothetical protein